MTTKSNNSTLIKRGAYVFLSLAVLTVLEFFIATGSVAASIPLMALIMVGKVALVVQYYMHLGKTLQMDAAEAHE